MASNEKLVSLDALYQTLKELESIYGFSLQKLKITGPADLARLASNESSVALDALYHKLKNEMESINRDFNLKKVQVIGSGVVETTSNQRSANLNGLYRKLKDLESMNMDFSQQERKIYQHKLDRAPGGYLEFETAVVAQTIQDEQLGHLASLRQLAKDIESSLREAVNILSRPTLRPLHILDLPDELLIKISGYVKGWEPHGRSLSESGGGVREIKTLRLTCKRFCNISTHLLIHFVRVELNPSSLSRLENISRHPAISRGVQGVRVNLHFCSSVLTEDIWAFGNFNVEKFREMNEFLERASSLCAAQ
jgi:hypothetical protein